MNSVVRIVLLARHLQVETKHDDLFIQIKMLASYIMTLKTFQIGKSQQLQAVVFFQSKM